jgi:hypothetical protein
MDRRFLIGTRRIFEKLTGLGETEYFHEAFAGGALGKPPEVDGAQYVYDRSFKKEQDINLIAMGWQVHLDHCGGLPGLENDQILDKFRRLILAGTLQNTYPKVKTHIFLVQPPPVQPTTVPASTTLIFDSTGVDYNTWCHVFYKDLNGQLFMWDSGQFGPGTVQTVVPGGATNIFIEGGVIGYGPIFYTASNLNPIVNKPYVGGDALPGGTVTITLSGTASAPSFSGI